MKHPAALLSCVLHLILSPRIRRYRMALLVFDIEQTRNASQIINISRVPKAGLVSFRFQTNAPTRYIVNPNCGVLEDDKSVPVKIELVGNRYNPQHKLALQAIAIQNKDQWKSIWDDSKLDEPGAFQTIWIEIGTTIMSLEQALNFTDPENAKVSISVIQLLNASKSKGAARVKELEGIAITLVILTLEFRAVKIGPDLKAMLRADNETLERNIEQTKNLKGVIEKQLEERTAETKELRAKEEKLSDEEERLNSDLMHDESELQVLKERRTHPENCILM